MSFSLFKSLFLITLGSAITAFGIINFAVTNQLADGGFTGITLILFHTLGISTAISNLILNIPMLIIGFRQFEKKTFYLTLFGTIALSFFLRIFEVLGPLVPSLEDDMILAAVSYGVVVGAGMGIIFREDATTGGSDIIAKLFNDKLGIPFAQTVFSFDTAVILVSFLSFLSFSNAVYTLIGLYIYSQIISKLLEGFHAGYNIFIISNHYKEISAMIQIKLGRGVTFLHGAGGYLQNEKEILLTVISKKQLAHLKRIIYDIDPECFVSVSHVYETLGEGFTFEAKVNTDIND